MRERLDRTSTESRSSPQPSEAIGLQPRVTCRQVIVTSSQTPAVSDVTQLRGRPPLGSIARIWLVTGTPPREDGEGRRRVGAKEAEG